MFDFQTLIGLDVEKAKSILAKNNYNNIDTIINSKTNEKCDSCIVCSVRESNEKVTLICGEFYLNLKG